MKHTHRFLLFPWLVAVVAALLCCFAGAGRDAIAPETENQKAIVEVARAFYDKNPYIQYDSIQMTAQDKNSFGVSRLSSRMPLDWASEDNILYSVCSDFCYDVYYYTFGYEVMGSARDCRTRCMTDLRKDASGGLIAFKYDGTGRDDSANYHDPAMLDKAVQEAWEQMQPGDIIVGYGYTKNNKDEPTSGHAMLFVGNYKGDGKDYIIHCSGSKIKIGTGEDSVENRAIAITNAYDACFNKGVNGTWNLYKPERGATFVIMRPLAVIKNKSADYPMTEQGKTRLTYSRLWVDRTVKDKQKYNGIRQGETLTVQVQVANYCANKDAENITVTEQLPTEGVILKSIPKGAKREGNTLTWVIDRIEQKGSGGTAKSHVLSYELLVTAPKGTELTLPGGTVAGLTTRPLTFRVADDGLDKKQTAKLQALTNDTSFQYAQGAFGNAVYQKLFGIDLHLPENQEELQNRFFDVIDVKNVPGVDEIGEMWRLKSRDDLSPQDQIVYDMFLPEHIGGYYVYLGDDPLCEKGPPATMDAPNRVKTFTEASYEPGDLFFAAENKPGDTAGGAATYLYLGNGKVAKGSSTNTGLTILDFADSIGLLLQKKHTLVVALRPSQAIKTYWDGANLNLKKGTDGTHSLTLEPQYTATKKLLVARYKSGRLLGVGVQSVQSDAEFSLPDDTDTVKIFSTSESFTPVAKPMELPLAADAEEISRKQRYATDLTLSKAAISLNQNSTITLSCKLFPENVERTGFFWISDDPSIADVDQTGKVTGKKQGSTTVTCYYEGGRLKASCAITVNRNNETPLRPVN